jgi:hypothetical protein
MSEWTAGYHAALGDLRRLAESRFAATFPTRFSEAVARLIADLRHDASIIDHEHLNRDQRAALDAERRAIVPRQGALL